MLLFDTIFMQLAHKVQPWSAIIGQATRSGRSRSKHRKNQTSILLFLYITGVIMSELFVTPTLAHDHPIFRHAIHVR
uniref:Uncharacterized protein n=1 Tax=Paraburkholderia sprentiae WSM5005 TaxID=754502 RepID=A0A1I9YHB2_9BURK